MLSYKTHDTLCYITHMIMLYNTYVGYITHVML